MDFMAIPFLKFDGIDSRQWHLYLKRLNFNLLISKMHMVVGAVASAYHAALCQSRRQALGSRTPMRALPDAPHCRLALEQHSRHGSANNAVQTNQRSPSKRIVLSSNRFGFLA
jgi:hypothetical protein